MTISMLDLAAAEDDRRFSPYCWRIRMALAHKGLDADFQACRFTQTDKIASFDSKTMPAIRDGERMVTDSWKIANYLEDTYPDRPSLFPNGRQEIMLIRYYADAVLIPGIAKIVLKDIYDHLADYDQPYFRESRESRFGITLEEMHANREKNTADFRASLAPLRFAVRNQNFVAGDAPAYSDYMVFGQFQWARAISDYPVLAADDTIMRDWINRMLDLHDGLARSATGYDV